MIQTAASACAECLRLLETFSETIHTIGALHQAQFTAVLQGDSDTSRLEQLIAKSLARKQAAKNAYFEHRRSHDRFGGRPGGYFSSAQNNLSEWRPTVEKLSWVTSPTFRDFARPIVPAGMSFILFINSLGD